MLFGALVFYKGFCMWWVFGFCKKVVPFFIASVIFISQSAVLFSMYQRGAQYGAYASGDRDWRRVLAMKERIALIQELRKEIEQKRDELGQASGDDAVAKKQQLTTEIKDIESVLEQYRNSAKSDPYGKLIALALAGEDSEILGDIPADNVLDGLKKGVTVRATRALGDVVNKKVGIFVNDTLGATWDSMYKACKIYAGKIWSLLFHHSHEPFTTTELDSWSELILSCLDDFAKLVKGRMEVESRTRDMTSRSFDNNDDQNVINQDQLVWESIVNGYAEQIDYFVEVIGQRMCYYKDSAIEVFYGRQLCNRLLAFKNIILSTRSLKDLSAKFGANATLLIAMNNNIKKLFKKLSDEVRPMADNGTQGAKQNQSSTDYYAQRRRYGERPDDYPLGFDDSYGGYGGL